MHDLLDSARAVIDTHAPTINPALAHGIGQRYDLAKSLSAVRGTRTVRKSHMVHNNYTPVMEVDAQTYAVRADGVLLTCEAATVLPMAQRHFLF